MGVDPRKCTVDFTNIGIDKDSNGQHFFVVTARSNNGDALGTGGDPFSSKMIHCEGGEVKVELVDNKDGTYTGTFPPVEAGSYFVVVGLLNPNGRVIDDMIKGSPFTMWVGPRPVEIPKEPADVRNSYVCGTQYKKALVKHKSFFTIVALDANKNKLTQGGDPFKTKILAPKGSKLPTIPSSVDDQQDGTYIVSYHPMAVGEYMVEVTLNDNPLPGTPFEVEATLATPDDEVDPQETQVEFTHSTSIDDRGEHNFVIIPKSINGHGVFISAQFKTKILSPERLEIKSRVYDNGNATYSARFKPTMDGVHLVHVDYRGTEPIKGSPFHVDWKFNGDVLDVISVVPAPEKLQQPQVDKVLRERSSSNPKVVADTASNSKDTPPSSPSPAKPISFTAPSLPKTNVGSPSFPRPLSGSYSKPPLSSPTSSQAPTGSVPSFLPKPATTTSAPNVPPKNPPKNPPPGSASKWKKSQD